MIINNRFQCSLFVLLLSRNTLNRTSDEQWIFNATHEELPLPVRFKPNTCKFICFSFCLFLTIQQI